MPACKAACALLAGQLRCAVTACECLRQSASIKPPDAALPATLQAQAAEPAVPDHEDRLNSLWADLDECLYLYEEEHAYDECTALAELARVVEDAVHTAGAALAGLRAAVKRQLLEGTRVFVCTIDATARMVTELQEHAVSLDGVCLCDPAAPRLMPAHLPAHPAARLTAHACWPPAHRQAHHCSHLAAAIACSVPLAPRCASAWTQWWWMRLGACPRAPRPCCCACTPPTWC